MAGDELEDNLSSDGGNSTDGGVGALSEATESNFDSGPGPSALSSGGLVIGGLADFPSQLMHRHLDMSAQAMFGRDSGGQDHNSQWAVPWSDLMMVMFVLFAVLFAMQLTERDIKELFEPELNSEMPLPSDMNWEEGGVDLGPGEGPPMSAEEILRESEKLIAEANLDNIDVALTDTQAIKVSVRGPMLFDLGKADLRQEVEAFLAQLAAVIAQNNYEIQVVGHTDNFPISTPQFPTNWELSSARAARVARYLIRAGRLEPGRFTVIGHALYRPVAPNTSLANKRQNRRVEIIITRNEYLP